MMSHERGGAEGGGGAGGGGGGRCEIRNPQAFLFSFSHWHVNGFLSKRIQNCPLWGN